MHRERLNRSIQKLQSMMAWLHVELWEKRYDIVQLS